jgi:hypothetical protein
MDEQMIEKCYRQNAQYQRAIQRGVWLGEQINRIRAFLHHGHWKPPATPMRPQHAG